MAIAKKEQPKKTEMAATAGAQQGTAIATEMPDYLKQNVGNRGRENVGVDDLVIPRLELVQDLSPARKKSDPNYIEGAEEGMLYNNVTRELYGTKVMVIPVGYVKEWLLWKDRKQGGGFGGAYPTEAEAIGARDLLEDGDSYEVVDTGQQFCILVHPDGRTEEIVVSMAKSKAKVSRKWNSLIRIANGDSFSRVYELSAVEDTNKQNQKYFNFAVRAAGFPPEPLYRKAEAMYKNIASGVVKADRGVDESGEAGDRSGGSRDY
jgi:hypothetical protein